MTTSPSPTPKQGNPPVMLMEETHLPAGYLLLFFPILAALCLLVLGSPRMPLWLKVAGHAAWIVPAIVFLAGLLRMYLRKTAERKNASALRDFDTAKIMKNDEAQHWIRACTKQVSSDKVSLREAHRGMLRNQHCEQFLGTIGSGEHAYPCFVSTVRTVPAPGAIWFARRAVRWFPALARPRFKLGPANFCALWDIAGDTQTANFFFTPTVISSLESLVPIRTQAWFWKDDRLAVLIRGVPTAHGVDTALNAVVSLAEQAGILPDRGPSADKIEVP